MAASTDVVCADDTEDDNVSSGEYERYYDVIGNSTSEALLTKIRDHFGADLQELIVLDAGGGYGSVAKKFADNGIGMVHMFDNDITAISRAGVKLRDHIKAGRVDLKKDELPLINHPNNYFDVVTMNRVLHHLDDGDHPHGFVENKTDPTEHKSYPNCNSAIREAYRVLRPGGLFLATEFTSQTVFENGQWYFHLMPEAHKRFSNHFPTKEFFLSCIRKVGFSDIEDCPTWAGWPKGDPTVATGKFVGMEWPSWFMATDEETTRMEDKVEEMRQNNEFVQFAHDHDSQDGAVLISAIKKNNQEEINQSRN